MSLEFDHQREDCPLLKELGEVIEVLEAHSLEMMGMVSQGRFIEFCQVCYGLNMFYKGDCVHSHFHFFFEYLVWCLGSGR